MKTARILFAVLSLAAMRGSMSLAAMIYSESFEGTLAGTLTGSIDQVQIYDDTSYFGQSTDVAHGAPSGNYHYLVFNGNHVGGTNTSFEATGGFFTSSNFNTLNGGSFTLTFDYGKFNGTRPQTLTVTVTDTVTLSLLLTQNLTDNTGVIGTHAVASPYSFNFTGTGNPVFLKFLDTTSSSMSTSSDTYQSDGILDYIVVTGPVPEPASLGLLGLGGLLVVHWRCR